MKVSITGRKMEMTEALNEHIKEKIRGMKEVLIDVAGKKNYKVRSDLGY